MSKKPTIRFLVVLVGLILSFLFAGSTNAQSAIDRLREEWRSLRSSLRASLDPLREPKFDLLLLNTFNPSEKKTEETTPNGLRLLPPQLVIVVGGLQASADTSKDFALGLQAELKQNETIGFAVYDYPNDGSILDSGSVLRSLLQKISADSPKTRITLVTHSMGGLVARQAIESAQDSERQNIDRLIMIFPPNHGSVLAQYADFLELADALSRYNQTKQSGKSLMLSLVDDGLGEACEELRPDSDFLKQLNSYPRAPNIRYTIFAGTNGPIDPLARALGTVLFGEIQKATRNSQYSSELVDESVDRSAELLLSDELTKGVGDGAVSIESARLPGVDDFQTVPLHHTEWFKTDRPAVRNLIRSVAKRLDS